MNVQVLIKRLESPSMPRGWLKGSSVQGRCVGVCVLSVWEADLPQGLHDVNGGNRRRQSVWVYLVCACFWGRPTAFVPICLEIMNVPSRSAHISSSKKSCWSRTCLSAALLFDTDTFIVNDVEAILFRAAFSLSLTQKNLDWTYSGVFQQGIMKWVPVVFDSLKWSCSTVLFWWFY